MRKFNLAILALLFCSLSAHAQGTGGTGGIGGKAGFGGGPSTGGSWSPTVVLSTTVGCSAGSASCTITLSSAVGSSNVHALVIHVDGDAANTVPNTKISSITGGGTVTLCPTSLCSANTTTGSYYVWSDLAVITSATSGSTALTVTLSGAPSNDPWDIQVVDATWTGSSTTFDVGNSTTSPSCTSCTAASLSLGGTTDYIVQGAAAFGGGTAISGSYTSPASFTDSGYSMIAGWLNTSSGAPPTVTQTFDDIFASSAVALQGH